MEKDSHLDKPLGALPPDFGSSWVTSLLALSTTLTFSELVGSKELSMARGILKESKSRSGKTFLALVWKSL